MKWWLISDYDVTLIKSAIELLKDKEKSFLLERIEYRFNKGLHKTDCIPADFSKEYTIDDGSINDWLD